MFKMQIIRLAIRIVMLWPFYKVQAVCPAGYVVDDSGDFCYKQMGSMKWEAGEAACRAEGSFLPLFSNAAAVLEMRSKIGMPSGSFWIGYDDRYTDGQWVLDGEGYISPCGLTQKDTSRYSGFGLKWENWSPGSPDNQKKNCNWLGLGCTEQACAAMQDNGEMEDNYCDDTVATVCQYRNCYITTQYPRLPTGEIVVLTDKGTTCTQSCNSKTGGECDFTNYLQDDQLDTLKFMIQAALVDGFQDPQPGFTAGMDVPNMITKNELLATMKHGRWYIDGYKDNGQVTKCSYAGSFVGDYRVICACNVPLITTEMVTTEEPLTTIDQTSSSTENESKRNVNSTMMK